MRLPAWRPLLRQSMKVRERNGQTVEGKRESSRSNERERETEGGSCVRVSRGNGAVVSAILLAASTKLHIRVNRTRICEPVSHTCTSFSPSHSDFSNWVMYYISNIMCTFYVLNIIITLVFRPRIFNLSPRSEKKNIVLYIFTLPARKLC